MKVKDLKEILQDLPEEFDEFDMVNGEFGVLDKEEQLVYRKDMPIVFLYVDEENKEFCLFHQTEGEIDKIKNHGE